MLHHRFAFAGGLAENVTVGGDVPPAKYGLTFFFDNLLIGLNSCCCFLGLWGEVDETNGVLAFLGESEVEFTRYSFEKFMGKLEKESCAISSCFVKAAATTVVHTDIHVEGTLDDVVGFFALQVTKEADSARVVFIVRVIEALGFWHSVYLI